MKRLLAAMTLATFGHASTAVADPLPPPGPTTFVRLSSADSRAVLERLVLPANRLHSPWDPPEEPTWERVCAAPCGQAVPLQATYRVAGEGITPTSGFALHAPETSLTASTGSAGVRSAGIYCTVLGFLVAAAGGVFFAVALNLQNQDTGSGNKTAKIASGVAMGAGGGVGLLGVGLILGSGSSVRDEHQKSLGFVPTGLHASFRF